MNPSSPPILSPGKERRGEQGPWLRLDLCRDRTCSCLCGDARHGAARQGQAGPPTHHQRQDHHRQRHDPLLGSEPFVPLFPLDGVIWLSLLDCLSVLLLPPPSLSASPAYTYTVLAPPSKGLINDFRVQHVTWNTCVDGPVCFTVWTFA